jgi:ribosomal protein S18
MNTFSYLVHKLNASCDELYNFDLSDLGINKLSTYFALDIKSAIQQKRSHATCNLIHSMIFYIKPTKFDVTSSLLTKFEFFKMMLTLVILPEESKLYTRDIHIRAQRHYTALCKFAYLFKFKRSPIRIDTDLYLNKISNSSRNVITIFQNKQRYLFTITDLNKIIETALCNSPYFISEPLPSKNPYNNLPFSKSDLYNIYFQIKDRLIKTPEVLYRFFISNFHLTNFQTNNCVLIREKYIKQFLENEDEYTMTDYIYSALSYNNHINVDVSFPKPLLISIFKPYLKLYLDMSYSLDISVKRRARYLLVKKLETFHSYNPHFGRKMFKKKIDKKYQTVYNTKHIEFEKNVDDLKMFLTSHSRVTPTEDEDDETLDEEDDHDEDAEEDGEDDQDEVEETYLDEINVSSDNTLPISETNNDIEDTAAMSTPICNANSDSEFRLLAGDVHPPNATVDDVMNILLALPRPAISGIYRREIAFIDVDFEEENEDLYDP